MKLEIIRIAKKPKYTIGKLYINGKYFSDTLEDTDRGLKDTMSITEINNKKVNGETCIPTGTYLITITYSPKFKTQMPLINGVKGFNGIRIHPSGNQAEDTEGCILVGENKIKGKLINSRDAFKRLYEILSKSTDVITLKVI